MPYQGHYQRKKEKQLQADQSDAKKELTNEAPDVRKKDDSAQEQDTAGKTENFFTRHVKLLTFLVCMVLFFVFFGPWNIQRFVEWKKEQDALENRMPEAYIEHLIDIGSELQWSDFSHYQYKVIAEGYAYIREYHTDEDRYLLLVSAAGEGKKLDSVILMRNSDGEQWQLLDTEAGPIVWQ